MIQCFAKFIAVILLCSAYCGAGEQPQAGIPKGLEHVWDPARYISIDEVKPGMDAYCLTVFKGSEVEKFGLEVLSVVRDVMPGRDAILVRGTDERFIHTGPVAGCSGSPVYINGRLAGALAFGWTFSKDPLYGVTPIAEMLRVSNPVHQKEGGIRPLADGPGITFDFSGPINLSQVEKKLLAAIPSSRQYSGGMGLLACPVVVSGISDSAREDLEGTLGPLGMEVISGGGGVNADVCDINFVPGACLTVPLVTGDITINIVGTATEVRGDDVYGFGHAYLGYGLVDLPMATGQVHTVVSSMMRSFKIATSTKIVGALTIDESAAVRGKLGAEAIMVPLKIRVSRYNDSHAREYNCRVINNRLLTPRLLQAVISGAALMRGNLPPDNTIRYKGVITLDGAEPIAFENVSTGEGLGEVIRDSVSPVALLMNNPYREVRIKSFDIDVNVVEKDITAAVWSAGLSKSHIKPGESIDVEVIIERYLAEKRKYTFRFDVPENTPPGTYQLLICGAADYEEFLKKAVPHRFTPENLETLIGALNDILAIGRDGLHCILILPAAGGVAMENAELPELPATKIMVLGDAKRATAMQAYPGWIDKNVRTGAIIIDKKIMNIAVEQ